MNWRLFRGPQPRCTISQVKLLSPARSQGNTRLYDDEACERLETIIALTRDLGVNLAGVEIIIGVVRDPIFGPVMMFGLGGIFVEVMKDVTFHLAPITAEEAMQMLQGTRSYALLKGATLEFTQLLEHIACVAGHLAPGKFQTGEDSA